MSTKFSVSVIVPMKRTYTFAGEPDATTTAEAKTKGLAQAQKDFNDPTWSQAENLTPVSQQNWSIGVTALD